MVAATCFFKDYSHKVKQLLSVLTEHPSRCLQALERILLFIKPETCRLLIHNLRKSGILHTAPCNNPLSASWYHYTSWLLQIMSMIRSNFGLKTLWRMDKGIKPSLQLRRWHPGERLRLEKTLAYPSTISWKKPCKNCDGGKNIRSSGLYTYGTFLLSQVPKWK